MLQPLSPGNPLVRIFNTVPFILQVVLGLCIGILLALVYPYDTSVLPTFGTLFVSALKAIAPLLVFVLVSAAIARHSKGVRTNMKPILAMYFISMALASLLALVMSYLFPSTFTELAAAADNVNPPQGISDVLLNFVRQAVDNPVNALLNGNYAWLTSPPSWC